MWIVGGLLLAAVFFVFGRTGSYEFINCDDGDYIHENPKVRHGLSAEGLVWAFQSVHAANWHPLTWLSHMADCQVYGLKAGGHHMTNVVLHAAATGLLFWVLRRMTGDLWPSAFVAAAFAVHPLHVESVAWVAERKDVLSGLLFMVTLAAYAGYARNPFSWVRYLAVVGCFGLGLMAKPMLVTLPLVLGLLDVWPLGRKDLKRAVLEKIPLLAMSAASCAVTLVAQRGAIVSMAIRPLWLRVENAVVSAAVYVGKSLVPIDLAVFYPYPEEGLSEVAIAVAALTLVGIGAFVWIRRRQDPYLLVGWLWYLGMLVPVIGLVQVGGQARADRYTYLPQIGLGIALAWGIQRMARWVGQRGWTWLVAVSVIVAWLVLASQQTTYWRNSEVLWNHALQCTGESSVVRYNLGQIMREQGRFGEAVEQYQKAIRVQPDFVGAHANLGLALHYAKRDDEAVSHLQRALQLDSHCAIAYNNLGVVLSEQGRFDEGISQFRQAIEVHPDDVGSLVNLANALVLRGRTEEAIDQYHKALVIDPQSIRTRYNLAAALERQGQIEEAITEFRELLRLHSDSIEARRSVDRLLMKQKAAEGR